MQDFAGADQTRFIERTVSVSIRLQIPVDGVGDLNRTHDLSGLF
jgi:hypothetical protein